MALGDQIKSFLKKQFIDVIAWTDPGEGVVVYRYPMQDAEIQNGAKLTVRESQNAMLVNEGRAADVYQPGLYTLNTQNMPVLTNLMNWDKMFESPFKSDVYFFNTKQNTGQRWGTAQPITIRDKEFGAIRMRGFGVYSWHVEDPKKFMSQLSGTRDAYHVADIEPQLRQTIVGRMSDAFAESQIPFLDMAANLVEVGAKIRESLLPVFGEIGIGLDTFVVENLSLPDELQKRLDERVGMNIIGNMGQYTQYQAAQSLPIAAANEGGGLAGIGVGLGAGVGLAQTMAGAMAGALNPQQPPPQTPPAGAAPAAPLAGAPVAGVAGETKFCPNCGVKVPKSAKFCTDCGTPQP